MLLLSQLIKIITYKTIKIKNLFLRYYCSKKSHKYLFVLSPPYSGSTLLHEILSKSSAVSPNNMLDTREGQQLPELKEKMFIKGRWEEGFKVNWIETKRIWDKYWDPCSIYHLDKSPANILRVNEINIHFRPIYYIILIRNPYAQCESLIRMNSWSAERSALFVIKCLKAQQKNIEICENHCIISYEELTTKFNLVSEKISKLASEINDLNFDKNFAAHNYLQKKMRPTNLNNQKIKSLSATHLKEINSVFNKKQKLLNFFKYEISMNGLSFTK